MINPKGEIFKWGPIDGQVIYIDTFTYGFELYPRFIDGTWPDVIGYFKDEKITFICDYGGLRDEGEYLFSKFVMDQGKLKDHFDNWQKTAESLLEYIDKPITGLNKHELADLFDEFIEKYNKFWLWGFLPELANWGGERIVKNMVMKSHPKNFLEIFEKICAPEDLSFFQKEELDFLKIKLIEDKDMQDAAITKHQKNYFWLRNSYGGTQVLNEKYFRDELTKLSKDEAKTKIDAIDNYIKNALANKKTLIEKYHLSDEIVKTGKSVGFCVWWQDLRKKYIFIACQVITQFLDEITKLTGIEYDDLKFYREIELLDLLREGKVLDLKQRKIGYVLNYPKRGKIEKIEGEAAIDFVKPYLDVKIDENIKEINGLAVSKGNGAVKARVCLLETPKHLGKMEMGEILVTSMTSPDFVVAMRKASAIITDEGGMTSHAAIVSRELGIPCIVGTKIATKILKDGDMIEVDADNGIVRKVEF